MSANAGRQVELSLRVGTEDTLIASCTTKSLKLNQESIDITSDDDAGWRALLADIPGLQSADISVEGVLKSTQLTALYEAGDDVELVFNIPTVRNILGTFRITSLEIGAPSNEGVTFSAEFQSSGALTFGAAEA